MKPNRVLLLSGMVIFLAVAAGIPSEFSPPSRTFRFTYQVNLKDIPSSGRQVRIWIPRAVSDSHQTVELKSATGPVHLRETREAAFGNRMFYAEMARPSTGNAQFMIDYLVTRKEYSRGDFASLARRKPDWTVAPGDQATARFLGADRLVPIDGRIKELADENTRGVEGTLAKAHALYDYVFQTVRYDKSGPGWGRGDSLWVCDSKHGNCTDFHSLFISMARAEGIPARFEIGFPVPAGAEGTIPGYHCWAEFLVNGEGWVPVDISEAWKDPKKHDYFFGTLDANRLQFSVGRDLVLEPKQAGEPLNYFIYPYVEVDGKSYQGVEGRFSYREVAAARQ
jgi:transglutaminase-like putative cysteine protease